MGIIPYIAIPRREMCLGEVLVTDLSRCNLKIEFGAPTADGPRLLLDATLGDGKVLLRIGDKYVFQANTYEVPNDMNPPLHYTIGSKRTSSIILVTDPSMKISASHVAFCVSGSFFAVNSLVRGTMIDLARLDIIN